MVLPYNIFFFFFLYLMSSFPICMEFDGWLPSSIWLCPVHNYQRVRRVSYMSPQSRLQLCFGHPRQDRPVISSSRILPSGSSWPLLLTWLNHTSLHRLNSTSNVSTLHLSATSLLLRPSSQVTPAKYLSILLSQLVRILPVISVTGQPSEPCSNTVLIHASHHGLRLCFPVAHDYLSVDYKYPSTWTTQQRPSFSQLVLLHPRKLNSFTSSTTPPSSWRSSRGSSIWFWLLQVGYWKSVALFMLCAPEHRLWHQKPQTVKKI